MKKIVFIFLFALCSVTAFASDNPRSGDIETAKSSKGTTQYVKVKTSDGYLIKDKSGKLLYRVVENDREKRTYDPSGKLVSRVSKK